MDNKITKYRYFKNGERVVREEHFFVPATESNPFAIKLDGEQGLWFWEEGDVVAFAIKQDPRTTRVDVVNPLEAKILPGFTPATEADYNAYVSKFDASVKAGEDRELASAKAKKEAAAEREAAIDALLAAA